MRCTRLSFSPKAVQNIQLQFLPPVTKSSAAESNEVTYLRSPFLVLRPSELNKLSVGSRARGSETYLLDADSDAR
jgi:hypothetical protein